MSLSEIFSNIEMFNLIISLTYFKIFYRDKTVKLLVGKRNNMTEQFRCRQAAVVDNFMMSCLKIGKRIIISGDLMV